MPSLPTGFSPKMFIFIHIEKSGGISLHTMLHNSFSHYLSPRPQIKSEFVVPEHVNRLNKLYPFHIDGMGGHKFCPALDYERCFDEPVSYFTFLRKPDARFLSHVNWQINVKGNDSNLEYYLEEAYFHNFQCYRLSGGRSFEGAREIIESKNVQLGLMERYEDSLFLLQQRVIQKFKPVDLKMNDRSSSYRKQYRLKELSPSILEKIRQVNGEDWKLYEYAVNKFPQSVVKGEYSRLKLFANVKRKISNRVVTGLLGV